jgi:glycosyltransferase involved in cell wall biosynthesis
MKLTYVANVRIPTEMAHGVQIMHMCEAFAENGAEVELVVPQRFSISAIGKKDPFEYYGVKKNFSIKKIFCFDLTPLNKYLGPISFLTQALSFAFFISFYLMFKKTDIVFSRDRFSLFFIVPLKKNVILEAHQFHRSLFKFILNKVKKIIVITKGLKDDLVKRGINENKIFVAADGVDLKMFNIGCSKLEARKKLNLPADKKLIIYIGQLYKWKGVETLARASKYLNKDSLVMIGGGIKWYLDNFNEFIKQEKLEKIITLGHQEYSRVPYFLKAADCLVLTGTVKYGISEKHTSPMKMFEYMTSYEPIVASDLPSFREILNEKNSILVESDNPQAMAEGIKKALNDAEFSTKISEQAHKDVQKYSWDNRAKSILEFINQ